MFFFVFFFNNQILYVYQNTIAGFSEANISEPHNCIYVSFCLFVHLFVCSGILVLISLRLKYATFIKIGMAKYTYMDIPLVSLGQLQNKKGIMWKS